MPRTPDIRPNQEINGLVDTSAGPGFLYVWDESDAAVVPASKAFCDLGFAYAPPDSSTIVAQAVVNGAEHIIYYSYPTIKGALPIEVTYLMQAIGLAGLNETTGKTVSRPLRLGDPIFGLPMIALRDYVRFCDEGGEWVAPTAGNFGGKKRSYNKKLLTANGQEIRAQKPTKAIKLESITAKLGEIGSKEAQIRAAREQLVRKHQS